MNRTHRTYQIQRIIGRHFFGRRQLRQYANGLATDKVYDVVMFSDEWNGMHQICRELMGMWNDVIESMRQEGADMIRIHISHEDLTKGDIKNPLQRIEDITPEGIMESMATVTQSNEGIICQTPTPAPECNK